MAKPGPKVKTVCRLEGCEAPRHVSDSGFKYSYCLPHQREEWAAKQAAHIAKATRKAQPTISLLLVDKASGEALRVTGVVQERVALEDLRGDGTQYERVAVALVAKQAGKGR